MMDCTFLVMAGLVPAIHAAPRSGVIAAKAQGCPGKMMVKSDRPRKTRRYRESSPASDCRNSEIEHAQESKSQTPRRHRGGRASRPSRLRRSLRCASRALTRARLDGFLQPRRFADRNGHTAGFGSKTSWSPIAAPSDRSHPQGRSAAEHPPWRLMGGYRLARTFEAPWRVDGDRAAWRRGVESKSSAPPRRSLSPDSPARRGNDTERLRRAVSAASAPP